MTLDVNNNVTYDCVHFGNYPKADGTKEPIKWRVLSVNGTEAFLIADEILEEQKYNAVKKGVTWETCTLRSWLNGYDSSSNAEMIDYTTDNFIDKVFTKEEQEAINIATVINDDNPEYETKGGNDTEDKIYLLSLEEMFLPEYGFLPSIGVEDGVEYDEARIRYNSEGKADFWWLRTPGGPVYFAGEVYSNGHPSGNGGTNTWERGICPVLHLDLTATEVWSNAGTVIIERIQEDGN